MIHGHCGRVGRIRRRETAEDRRWARWIVGAGCGRTQHHQADGLGVKSGGLLAGRERGAGFGADVDQALAGFEAGQGLGAGQRGQRAAQSQHGRGVVLS